MVPSSPSNVTTDKEDKEKKEMQPTDSMGDAILTELKNAEAAEGLKLHCSIKNRDTFFLKRDEMRKITKTWEILGKTKPLRDAWGLFRDVVIKKYKENCPQVPTYDQSKECLMSDKVKIPELSVLYSPEFNCNTMDLFGAANFISDEYVYNGPRALRPKPVYTQNTRAWDNSNSVRVWDTATRSWKVINWGKTRQPTIDRFSRGSYDDYGFD